MDFTITTGTPAQIDTEIARLGGVIARAESALDAARTTIKRIDEADDFERSYPWNSTAKYNEAVAERDASITAIASAREQMFPLNEEFTRRGGWNRYYLVTNTGGHVHWTTGCDTCFPTTQFAWLTEYSGMEHDAFVEEAGEKACTVCFPNAPVDTLSRSTKIEAPERKARRLEREAKAAAAAVAAVVVENYIGWRGTPEIKTFKTARAATNDIANALGSLCWYGEEHPSAVQWLANVNAVRNALAAKGVDYDYDKALAAARKKVTREGSKAKF